MEIEQLLHKLSEAVPSQQILINESMSNHTTFRVGGAADVFVEIETLCQLKNVLAVLRFE